MDITKRLEQLTSEYEAGKARMTELDEAMQSHANEYNDARQKLAMSLLRLEGAMTVLREQGAVPPAEVIAAAPPIPVEGPAEPIMNGAVLP